MKIINPINPARFIKNTKPIITNVAQGDTRKLCSFVVPENKFGKLYLDVKMPKAGYGHNFITELRNRFDKLMGYEEFAYFEGSPNMSGLFIRVNDEYKQKGFNFGEILRLSSIIEIMENKVKNFEIISKDTAIYFHAKYKFTPNLAFSDRDKFLKTLSGDKSNGYEKFSQKAQDMADKLKIAKENADIPQQRKICAETNEVLGEYLDKVIAEKSQKQHPINYTMPMTLTDENILKNKEFFNQLFKKHGIDYNV